MKNAVNTKLKVVAGSLMLAGAAVAVAGDVSWDRLLNAHKDPNNWLMYHQDFNGYHHSGLDQINTSNVKNLGVAWIHTPNATKRGIQSFPLAVDGILYYTSASGKVWALDGTNGKAIWSYQAKLETPSGDRPTPQKLYCFQLTQPNVVCVYPLLH